MACLSLSCTVDYPGFHLDATLKADLDGVTALFGPSGSGKTTLLRTVAGLERRARGHVVLDEDVWQDDSRRIFIPPHRRGVGFVFQDSRLFPHMSVRANMLYGRRRAPKSMATGTDIAIEHVTDILGLKPLLDRRASALSGGERQRVAIARAVLSRPRLLLMDEPLASLDAGRKEEILPLIQRLAGELAIPILYVTHAIEEILRLASRVVLIDGGKLLAHGALEDITNRLDLRTYTGRLDAGSVLRTTVRRHDREDGLTRLAFEGGEILSPLIDLAEGTPLNIRIRSRDVALSLHAPTDTSILNVLPATVVEITEDSGPHAHVRLDVGVPLWARIMRKSVRDLELEPGKPVFALIKAVAVDRRSTGIATAMDDALSTPDV